MAMHQKDKHLTIINKPPYKDQDPGGENLYKNAGGNKNKRKRKRSDSVLWQEPLHQQKWRKGKEATQTTPQKSSITQRLQTDLGR